MEVGDINNMPSISKFYGITIYMYLSDNNQHHRPHIHAIYSGEEAIFDIENVRVLEGKIPKKQTRLAQAWIEIHKDELMENWKLAIARKEVYKIEPLR